MQIETLADEARNSISDYCVNECKAYCCRKGFLVLEEAEVDLVTGDQKEFLKKEECLVEMENRQFSLNFNKHGCPSLKHSKCTIHKNKDRPKTCKDFPIFVDGNKIRFSPRCYAIIEGKLFSYIKQFVKLGYELD